MSAAVSTPALVTAAVERGDRVRRSGRAGGPASTAAIVTAAVERGGGIR